MSEPDLSPAGGLSGRPRVLLAEPDRPTRAGVRRALTRGGLEVAGEAADAATAVALAEAARPELALVAAELPGGGLAAARRIVAGSPGVRVVVLSGHPNG